MLCGLTVWRGSLTVAAGWPWWESNLFLSLSVWTSGAFLCVPCLKEGNRRYSFWRESRRWEAPGLTLRCIISNAQKWCLTDDLKVFQLFRLMVKYEVCFVEEGGIVLILAWSWLPRKIVFDSGWIIAHVQPLSLKPSLVHSHHTCETKSREGKHTPLFAWVFDIISCNICLLQKTKNKNKKQTVVRLEVSWMLHLKCVTRIKQMANKICSIKNNNNMETENVMWPCNMKSSKKGDQWLERWAL